jgi:hypothetical protein
MVERKASRTKKRAKAAGPQRGARTGSMPKDFQSLETMREALFTELDWMAAGQSNAANANALAGRAGKAIRSMRKRRTGT